MGESSRRSITSLVMKDALAVGEVCEAKSSLECIQRDFDEMGESSRRSITSLVMKDALAVGEVCEAKSSLECIQRDFDEMGESSRRSITSLVMKDALAVGEVPTKKRKQEKPERKVLEEEEYLTNLDKIIQRDFFPDIPKLRAQSEYVYLVPLNTEAGAEGVGGGRPERKVLEEEEYLTNLDKIIQRDFFPDIPKLRAQSEYVCLVPLNTEAGAEGVEGGRPERKVLKEEEYLTNLDKIIQRDFFPDIPKLRAQSEYLAAVERNDVAKIRELQLRFSSRRTEPRIHSPTLRRSPSTFETPDVKQGPEERPGTETQNPECPAGTSNTEEVARTGKSSVDIDGLSVDKYLAKFNSEDNAAFDDIQKLDDRRHKIKHGWMYKAEIAHNRKKVDMDEAQALLPADEQLAIGVAKPKTLDNWSYKAQNAVLFKPVEVELTEAELIEAAKLEPPAIINTNTRFTANPFSEEVRRDRMTKAGIIQAAKNKGCYDAQGQEVPAFPGALGPMVTPSPAPGVLDSPMMTWGEIEGTPFRLDAGDTPLPPSTGPSFKMPEVPLRDQLAQTMTEQIARRHRLKKEKALAETKTIGLKKTPSFGSVRGSSVERLSSMSPAARRLASNKLGIRLGTDKALKDSYTPSPMRAGGKSTPLVSPIPGRRTPKSGTPSASPASSLTDGLLNLSSSSHRPSASDYF